MQVKKIEPKDFKLDGVQITLIQRDKTIEGFHFTQHGRTFEILKRDYGSLALGEVVNYSEEECWKLSGEIEGVKAVKYAGNKHELTKPTVGTWEISKGSLRVFEDGRREFVSLEGKAVENISVDEEIPF